MIAAFWPTSTRTDVPGRTARVESRAARRIGNASATARQPVTRMSTSPDPNDRRLLQERPRQYELGRHEVYEQAEHVHQSRDEGRGCRRRLEPNSSQEDSQHMSP